MSQYANPAVLLEADLLSDVEAGKKVATVRTGHRDYNTGLTQIDATEGTRDSVVVDITRVDHILVKDLMASDEIAQENGCETAEGLMTRMIEIYVDELEQHTEEEMRADDFKLTVVNFDLIETLPGVRPNAQPAPGMEP